TSGRSRESSNRPQSNLALMKEIRLIYTGVAAALPPPTAGAPDDGVEEESGASRFLGGRGGRPSMMSSIWSESMVSHSSSAAAMASILSRVLSLMSRSEERRVG